MAQQPRIGLYAIFNWTTLFVSMAVAFFLSPFLVHRLGNTGYGIWTLVNSIIAYMTLLDLGLRGTVTRFVSRYHAQGDHAEASRSVSAAFWLRLWTGAVIVVGTAMLATTVTSLLRIPADMQFSARWAVVMVGTSLAVTMTFGIFGGVLAALQRFDILCVLSITQTALRTAGTIWLLRSGYSIVALALWELSVVVLANAALTTIALRVYREIRIVFRRPDSGTLRQLGGYSFYLVIVNGCNQVIMYTDTVVVGAFVSAAAVTFYTIGGGLLEYARQTVSALGQSFMPLASSLDARGENDKLRKLLFHGTCATLLIGLPVYTALFFRGHTFIDLWLGREYGQTSGAILQVLLVGQIFLIAQYTNYNILCGLGKQKPLAIRMVVEASANLMLSMILVRRFGLIGVAWGTLIPSVVNNAFFGSRYTCRLLGVSVAQFVRKTWIRSGVTVIPFGFACYLADRFWSPVNMARFAIQMAAILPVFLLSVCVVFWREISAMLPGSQNWLARSRNAALAFVKRP